MVSRWMLRTGVVVFLLAVVAAVFGVVYVVEGVLFGGWYYYRSLVCFAAWAVGMVVGPMMVIFSGSIDDD